MLQKYILPNPFFLGSYKVYKSAHDRILDVNGASENSGSHNHNNLLRSNTVILPEVEFSNLPDDRPEDGHYFNSTVDMELKAGQRIAEILPKADQLLVLGGDHTVSMGTGFGISQVLDMKKVGLIYVDTHGDSNTPDSSNTKSVYGYPAAVNCGFGHPEMINPFKGNFIQKICHIGLSDIDIRELEVMKLMGGMIYSCLDIVELGMKTILDQTLEYMSDCEYIWLSMDIDALDPTFFAPLETDVPVIGGMIPRELMYIAYRVQQTQKLKVSEIVQINDIGRQTPVISLASRLAELCLGLGSWRYGK